MALPGGVLCGQRAALVRSVKSREESVSTEKRPVVPSTAMQIKKDEVLTLPTDGHIAEGTADRKEHLQDAGTASGRAHAEEMDADNRARLEVWQTGERLGS